MSLNPGQVKLGVRSTCPKAYLKQKYNLFEHWQILTSVAIYEVSH